ncbi:AMP-binding enzyme [Nesterenkonia populi]|uniref:AMP-binding enzyme n=1 Tax=Nesterenkonia populi TaxID=1591087 RepID=UPI0011BE0FDD|nr:acyl-CoA synthetase [Nesterenkonia populi]
MSTTDRTKMDPDQTKTGEPRFHTDPPEEDLEAMHDDEVTVNGQEVHLNDIRDAMNSHEGVLESGVCSISDDEAGSIPVAFVVLSAAARDEVNATRLPPDDGSQTRSVPPGEKKLVDSVQALVAEKVSEEAVPRKIIPVLEMPKDKEGQVISRVLGRLYAGEDPEDASGVQNQKCLASIKKLCQEMGTAKASASAGGQ